MPSGPETYTCYLLLLSLLLCATQQAQGLNSDSLTANNSSPFFDEYKCKTGIFLPKWLPSENMATGDRIARAIVYFLALFYLFLGVSIIAERFMSAIEVITAKEKEVVVTKPDGEKVTLHVKIWNETVSNLTLMALGSSAPEIMLTAIEIIGNDFQAGHLGPGTIVGSAAFNLFCIIGLCIYIIPRGEVRRIKHLRVFFVTATWSIVAYLWLYLIVATISPGVIQIWEGVVTLFLFPLTVSTAYFADKYLIPKKKKKQYRPSRHHNVMIEMEGGSDTDGSYATVRPFGHHEELVPLKEGDENLERQGVPTGEGQTLTNDIILFEKHRKQYIAILRDLRIKHPNMAMKELEELAQKEVINRGPKSRAFYRVMATRRLTGTAATLSSLVLDKDRKMSEAEVKSQDSKEKLTTIVFEPAHYTVMEDVGSLNITVKRQGLNLIKNTVYVDYKTQDGTAVAGSDYDQISGTLVFQPEEMMKTITINIIDDDIYEEDEHFYVKLGNLRYSPEGKPGTFLPASADKGLTLGTPAVATVMILDDDHAGAFHFEDEVQRTSESADECLVKVKRSSGARGVVRVPYKSSDLVAKAGVNYTAVEGDLIFENDEFEKNITVPIMNSETYQMSISFLLQLREPVLIRTSTGVDITEETRPTRDPNNMTEEERVAEMGKPRLGDVPKIEIVITENEEFKRTVDQMLDKGNVGLLLGTSSWAEQFRQSITVGAACEQTYGAMDGDEDESGEEEKPGPGDYIMHYLSLFWKVLFATVPPTDYGGGWWCFTVSMAWIAILTGIIGDLASSFGCTVRLKDSVTAVTFVALGTSVPDTFASKVAALGDKYADSSIGNVTGSNAVNVFLGIGVAWTLAAIVNAVRGQPFTMQAGNLAFSLTVFCVFALSAIALLVIRRTKYVGGELGGPSSIKVLSSCYLFLLWILYISLSALEAYGYIQGF